MRLRAFVFALATAVAVLPAGVSPASAATVAIGDPSTALTDQELMRATALDAVFAQFGPGIEMAPQEQALPFPANLSAAWVAAAREVFDADAMQRALADAIAGKFTPEDYEVYGAFFNSEFGIKVTEIERAVTIMPPEAQMGARDAGVALADAAAGTERARQIDEMLSLVSADISKAMVRQSVRGMLIGMSVNGQQGDIEVPWDEIDVQLNVLMPGIEADVALTQRAMMFFAYRNLSDADLETYLEFLRTDSARKFYAVAAYAIGQIVAERMEAFGETLARKLDQVNI